MKKPESEALIGRCLDGYAAALSEPAPAPIDPKTSQPDLGRFLRHLSSNHQAAFLQARTTRKGAARRLRILTDKTLPAHPTQTKHLKRWWSKYCTGPATRRYAKLLAVARPITTT